MRKVASFVRSSGNPQMRQCFPHQTLRLWSRSIRGAVPRLHNLHGLPPFARMAGSAQDTLTAYHEAGHAVIAILFGRAVQEVSILPGGKRLGHCEMRKGGTNPKDALEADLLILLAGMAAEAKVSGQYGLPGASQDLQMAERLALTRAGNARQAQRLLERTLDKVEHLMRDAATWSAIDLIATELVKSRFLSGRAARHFHEQAMARSKK